MTASDSGTVCHGNFSVALSSLAREVFPTWLAYLMDGTPSLRTYLRDGAAYTAAVCAHLPRRPTQIWIALYTACITYVDDALTGFPLEKTNIYRFNERFSQGQAHGNGILDALTDLLHQVPRLGFQPVSSNLIVTSTLDFVTANLLEHETKSMQVLPSDVHEISSLTTAGRSPALPNSMLPTIGRWLPPPKPFCSRRFPARSP